jgi:hypothetical protein
MPQPKGRPPRGRRQMVHLHHRRIGLGVAYVSILFAPAATWKVFGIVWQVLCRTPCRGFFGATPWNLPYANRRPECSGRAPQFARAGPIIINVVSIYSRHEEQFGLLS